MKESNKTMNPTELKKEIQTFLKQHKSGTLATTMDSMPRCSPIQYFMGENMDLYIISAGGDKFKAIEKNNNVCILVNTEYVDFKKIKGVQIFGKATTSEKNRTLFEEALKYCSEPYVMEMNRESLKVIKVVADEIVYLDSTLSGDRTKQVLKQDKVTTR